MNNAIRRPLTFLLIACFILVFAGCEVLGGEEDGPQAATNVIVANGGNFSDQNGFLTVHDPATDETDHLMDLQGFVHGLELEDDRLYVMVNTFGPGRIDVFDTDGMTRVDQFDGLPSPRDLIVPGDVAWVVGFTFGEPGTLIPVDVETGVAGDGIEVGDVPQSVAMAGDLLFVANNGSLGAGTTLSVVDPEQRTLVATMETGCDGPRDLYATDSTTLLVVCSGKTVYNDDFSEIVESTDGQVLFVDAVSRTVTSRIELPAQARSTNDSETAALSRQTGELFITMEAEHRIAVVDVEARSLASLIDVAASAGLTGLSGIGYDPADDEIYVGRLPVGAGPFPDFAAAGTVVVIGRDGAVRSSFEVGPSVSAIVLR